jgi:hypothetical protein
MLNRIGKNEPLQLMIAIGVGVTATALTYAAVGYLFPTESYLHSLFFDRSWIQYATTLTFWTSMAILALRNIVHRFESAGFRAAQRVLTAPELASTFTWTDASRIRALFVNDACAQYHGTLVFTRIINAMDRLRKMQSTRELDDYLSTRSEMDFGELDTSYSGLRYLIWLIPTLGFLGTVMGIGLGIAGFSDIIQSAENFEAVKEALPRVTMQLGTAFDTTLLALVLSALCMFYQSFVLKNEEALLERIDVLCIDGVCALFREHSEESERLATLVRELTENVKTAMSGNRAEVARVIVDELPGRISAEALPRIERLAKYLASAIAKGPETDASQSTESVLTNIRGEIEAVAESQRAARESIVELTRAVTKLAATVDQSVEQGRLHVLAAQDLTRELRASGGRAAESSSS